ncbi:(2E,6E)-farnesyl diphosphate synthase [Pasteurella skyensis]|uniref:(2E,6E)-farnesyl diphosphate synthase n=1 Tax=Phocoenobacter skyensis TaxID=97481 RepID=A0AAJ6NF43_9PAST|nr:farnesyl diphosphate synthase [Pasteurella skyensis]MDP8162270.1 (2E,6E)-farnesyl diphosphate synthase [Pasteurella skyensis]MDP8172734.1 (2E,6E)-farnesyl diphosphate synthase [Pasteurella skyensis]MDP8175506.1 (2E,6E)-farnesyl diphosphate synthase [Pasteurella skyensis]MDP8179234.1 (2E,6E)-farnesyl diphosphate synthase [Pasteurella skyensis]MDP8183311.1 (2E,6E)-farnesyl diphosphate synthase [Pasteurella skyensis]
MQYFLSLDLIEKQQRVNQFLDKQLSIYKNEQSPLGEAMSYAVLLGGKRIRPFLVYTTGKLLGVSLEKLDHSAAAIEAIHAYSLVHDDLPAMDNDELRRGQATCHIAFDDATAILAGDALQSFAFELITQDPHLTASQKVAQIQVLSHSAGAKGMCLGQSLDLLAENKSVDIEALKYIHRNKTGALIEASILMGLNVSEYVNDPQIKQSLIDYAKAIGLAFQVQDDILDIIGDADKIGKTVGADESLNKSTYPKLLGLEGAKTKAKILCQNALSALETLPFDTTELKALADFVVNREN